MLKGHRQKNSGFTLVELMVALSVLAILAAIAVPSFANLLKRNQLTAVSNNLLASISTARSEAIKRREDVTLEPAGTDWKDGWVVKSATEEFTSSEGTTSSAIKSSGTSSMGAITFNARGYTSVKNPWGNGTGVVFCDDDGRGRVVTVKTSGTVKVTHIDSSCSV